MEIGRVDVGRKPELRGVGEGDHLVLRVERPDGGDRAEDLLTQDACVVGDVREDGRLEEEPGPVDPLAACHELRPAAYGVGHQALETPTGRLVDERPSRVPASDPRPADRFDIASASRRVNSLARGRAM